MKQNPTSMVARWFIAMQELDFTVHFVKGSDNELADALSRWCLRNLKVCSFSCNRWSSLFSSIDSVNPDKCYLFWWTMNACCSNSNSISSRLKFSAAALEKYLSKHFSRSEKWTFRDYLAIEAVTFKWLLRWLWNSGNIQTMSEETFRDWNEDWQNNRWQTGRVYSSTYLIFALQNHGDNLWSYSR